MIPTSGDVNMGSTTFGQSPMAAPFLSVALQMRTLQLPAAVAIAAPQRPPISAWLELEGRPSHQVKRFQMMAASSAASTVVIVTAEASTSPPLMVFATAVPTSAPIRFQNAAHMTAARGLRTLVETTVAIALAVSWKPLMYSNVRAASRTMRKRVMGGRAEPGPGRLAGLAQECLSTICTTTLPALRQRSTACSTIW